MSRNLLIAFLFLIPAYTATVSANDSPGFRGDPEHPGVYEAAPVAKFTQIKWKFQTKELVLSSPAVVGNTLYVGSADHNLYAVDIATGAQKWVLKTGSSVTSSPAVANSTVYFLSYDGDLQQNISTARSLPPKRCLIRSMFIFPRPWCGRALARSVLKPGAGCQRLWR